MAKSSTTFQKGHKNLKPKGAKSKKTLVLDTFAKHIVEGGMEKFEKELNKLTGKQFVDAYLAVFEYVKPKLARTDITTNGENINKIDIPLIKWIDESDTDTSEV